MCCENTLPGATRFYYFGDLYCSKKHVLPTASFFQMGMRPLYRKCESHSREHPWFENSNFPCFNGSVFGARAKFDNTRQWFLYIFIICEVSLQKGVLNKWPSFGILGNYTTFQHSRQVFFSNGPSLPISRDSIRNHEINLVSLWSHFLSRASRSVLFRQTFPYNSTPMLNNFQLYAGTCRWMREACKCVL